MGYVFGVLLFLCDDVVGGYGDDFVSSTLGCWFWFFRSISSARSGWFMIRWEECNKLSHSRMCLCVWVVRESTVSAVWYTSKCIYSRRHYNGTVDCSQLLPNALLIKSCKTAANCGFQLKKKCCSYHTLNVCSISVAIRIWCDTLPDICTYISRTYGYAMRAIEMENSPRETVHQ